MCAERNKNIPVNDAQPERGRDSAGEECAQDHNNTKETDDKLVGDDRELAEAQRSESVVDKDGQKEHTQHNNY